MQPADLISKLPLDREVIAYAVDSIPQDKNTEMVAEMSRSVASNDPAKVRESIRRWVMIGSHYADPNRQANHPLNKVLGAFANDPLFDDLMNQIKKNRRKR